MKFHFHIVGKINISIVFRRAELLNIFCMGICRICRFGTFLNGCNKSKYENNRIKKEKQKKIQIGPYTFTVVYVCYRAEWKVKHTFLHSLSLPQNILVSSMPFDRSEHFACTCIMCRFFFFANRIIFIIYAAFAKMYFFFFFVYFILSVSGGPLHVHKYMFDFVAVRYFLF